MEIFIAYLLSWWALKPNLTALVKIFISSVIMAGTEAMFLNVWELKGADFPQVGEEIGTGWQPHPLVEPDWVTYTVSGAILFLGLRKIHKAQIIGTAAFLLSFPVWDLGL